MRKKKKLKLKEDAFWASFCFFNLPKEQDEIPVHMRRVNFRLGGVTDEGLELMAGYIKTIEQLDLDETEITVEGVQHLTRLQSIKELRLKGCRQINNDALPYLFQLQDLELLHLGGTSISVEALTEIGKLKQLKTLLISADENEMDLLPPIAAQLPAGCEFIVNHQNYP